MKIQLEEPMDKNTFLNAISDFLNEFPDDISVSGELDLDFFQRGKPIRLCLRKIEEVKAVGLSKKGLESLEETAYLEAKLFTDPMQPESDTLKPYHFFESDVEGGERFTEVIGIAMNEQGKEEKVLSVESYCEQEGIPFIPYDELIKIPHIVTEQNIRRSVVKGLFEEAAPYALTKVFRKLELAYRGNEVLENNGLRYISWTELEGTWYEYGGVKGLTAEQLQTVEPAYTIPRVLLFGDPIEPVYLKEEAYEQNGYVRIEEAELKREKGTTLFSANGLRNYFPNTYGVEKELIPYGYSDNGTLYSKLARPLYDIFGLIPKEDIGAHDFLVRPNETKTLRKLLSEHGVSMSEILPDGMTKDYQLVYRGDKIPLSVKVEYHKWWHQKQERELKRKQGTKQA